MLYIICQGGRNYVICHCYRFPGRFAPGADRRRGLVVIPLSYTISGKEHLCLAPEGYDSAAFFQTMKLRGEVSTSMVPPHRFLTFLKPLLRSGLDLLFLSASSGLSSSYQSACMAAEQLREEFPQRKLQIVDSLSSSLGQGLLVLRAFDLRERGMCLEDTARTLLSLRHRIAHLFTVDDLMYLSRGGRLSGAKAMLGTALGLKPLLKGDPNGRIVLCGKARGRAPGHWEAGRPIQRPGPVPRGQTVCIAHGQCPPGGGGPGPAPPPDQSAQGDSHRAV